MLLSEKILCKRWMPRITELCWSQAGSIYSGGTKNVLFCGPTKLLFNTGSSCYCSWVDYTNPASPYVVSTSTDNLRIFSSPDSSSSSMMFYGVTGENTSPGRIFIHTRTINPFTEVVNNSSTTISNVTTSGSINSGGIILNNTPVWTTEWTHLNPNYTGSVLYSNTTKLLDHSTGGTVYRMTNKLSDSLGQYVAAANTSSVGSTYHTVTTSSASTTNVPRVDLVYNGAYYHKGTGALLDTAKNVLTKYDTNFVEQWSTTITNKTGEDVFVHLLGAYNGNLYVVAVPESTSSTNQVCTIHKINPNSGEIVNSYDFANSTTGFKNRDNYTWANSCNAIRNHRVVPTVSYNGYFAMIVTPSGPTDIITIKVP